MHTPEQRVAEELGIPEEQVELIVKHHWEGVKYYLQHPHLVKRGIFLAPFMRFILNTRKIKKWVESGRTSMTRQKTDNQYFIDIYNNIVDGIKQKYLQDERRIEESDSGASGNGERSEEE